MPDSQAHAIVGHLLQVQTERDLTEGQEKFLEVLIAELVHRRSTKPWPEQCRCRVCRPAEPMRSARPADPDEAIDATGAAG